LNRSKQVKEFKSGKYGLLVFPTYAFNKKLANVDDRIRCLFYLVEENP